MDSEFLQNEGINSVSEKTLRWNIVETMLECVRKGRFQQHPHPLTDTLKETSIHTQTPTHTAGIYICSSDKVHTYMV